MDLLDDDSLKKGLLWLYLFGFGYMALALEPGFLDFDNLPDTNFSCIGKVIGGYYADLETNCQMFHVCTIGQLDEPMDIRFLCLNGTVFDQETRVCERIDEVDCSKSEQFYSLNLELYGNTQPPVLEESPETDLPIVIKSSTTTTTTTTTPKPQTTKNYYTTPHPTTPKPPKVISTHHFPISNPSDIRFNPAEINISLNPGAPPDIKTNPTYKTQHYHSHENNLNKKSIVTFSELLQAQKAAEAATTPKPKSVVSYGLTHDNHQHQAPVTASDINYGFTYRNKEDIYQTENPNYQYRSNFANFNNPGIFRNQFKTTTLRNQNIPVSSTTPRKLPSNSPSVTTYRNPYVTILKSPSYHHYKTEKPQRLQLPLPLPTLPPLTFSSPAPFSLTKHIETKRYTNEHQAPPRIIISASASVSDASGRRLNYSLGTIGLGQLLEQPPRSYDDEDIIDSFYQDVPKLKSHQTRRKRQATPVDPIKSEQEAIEVLRFLFDWYKRRTATTTIKIPVHPEDITEINQQLKAPRDEDQQLLEEISVQLQPPYQDLVPPKTQPNEYTSPQVRTTTKDLVFDGRTSSLFRSGSKFNIIGDVLSISENTTPTSTTSKVETQNEDYLDDSYDLRKETTLRLPEISLNDGPNNRQQFKKDYPEYVDDNYEATYSNEGSKPPTVQIEESNKNFSDYNYADYFDSSSHPEVSDRNQKNDSTIMTPEVTSRSNFEEATKYHNYYQTTEHIPEHDSKDNSLTATLSNNFNTYDYVNDNYEPLTYNDSIKIGEEHSQTTTESVKLLTTPEDAFGTTEYQSATIKEMDAAVKFLTTTADLGTTEQMMDTTTSFDYDAITLPEGDKENITTDDLAATTEKSSIFSEKTTTDSTTYKLLEIINVTDDTTTSEETSLGSTTESHESTTDNPKTTTLVEEIPTISSPVEITTSSTTPTSSVMTFTNATPLEITTEEVTTTRRTSRRRGHSRFGTDYNRDFTRRPSSNRRPKSRHRFSTSRDYYTTTTPSAVATTTSTPSDNIEDIPATDAPLAKSAKPTQPETERKAFITTPLVPRPRFIFNCFGKPLNKFYSDPRDCRLFHYCTSGYNKNQLLDMKFVCDLGTYFDVDQLICTKVKPERCM